MISVWDLLLKESWSLYQLSVVAFALDLVLREAQKC